MNRTTLSSKTQRMPVLDVLPMAYWVGGDTGMKQTSQMAWKNVIMVVEELACIVPIPIAYLDDADVPLWSQVQPRITEAVGALIDAAVLWGINKPTTWGEAVYTGAGKSGQVVVEGTGVDLGQDVTELGMMMAQSGYSVSGFAGMPGMAWKLAGIRSSQGIPVFQPDMSGTPGGKLYGYNITEIENGSWQVPAPTAGALILAGDFKKAIIGMRQDITFKMFTEGVISDDTGKVILNLMQQDAVAMRMTMRLAYATVNPVTIMKPGVGMTARWPFGAVLGTGTAVPATGPINVIGTYPGGTLLSTGDGNAVAEIHQGSQWEEDARENQFAAVEGDRPSLYDEGVAGPVEERQTADQVRETAERHQQRAAQRSQKQAGNDQEPRHEQRPTRRQQRGQQEGEE
jgi:hypothetical protein